MVLETVGNLFCQRWLKDFEYNGHCTDSINENDLSRDMRDVNGKREEERNAAHTTVSVIEVDSSPLSILVLRAGERLTLAPNCVG